MARLGDICTINPKSPGFQDKLIVSFIPMTKVGENGEFDPSERKTYQEVKKGFTYFQNGDVLFAKITPCMENGKGAIAQSLENGIGFGSTEFHVLRPLPEYVTSEWLFYFLSWPAFRKEAEKNMTGSAGQKRVPKSFLAEYVVDVPNLSTQKKTTNTLDKICNLISLRKQQLAKLDELVKARFVEMFGDPIRNERDWRQIILGDLCDVGSSKRIFEKEYVSEGVPFYRTKEIVELSKGNKISTELFISESRFEEIKQFYGVPQKNDLLISAVGTIGTIWIVDGTQDFYFKDGNLLRISSSPKFDSIYMKYLLENLIDNYKQKMSVGTAYAALTIVALKNMLVYDVPLNLQRQFSEFVEQISRQKLTIQQSLDKLEVLKKSLMQEYFR